MSTDTGGPAFPHPDYLAAGWIGMTLRDYFAAKAIAGLCANPGGPFQANGMNGWGVVNCTASDIAATAYDLADAMLKARRS